MQQVMMQQKEASGKIVTCFRNALYLLCFKKTKQCLLGSHTDIHVILTFTLRPPPHFLLRCNLRTVKCTKFKC